jgi:hypothetical protein
MNIFAFILFILVVNDLLRYFVFDSFELSMGRILVWLVLIVLGLRMLFLRSQKKFIEETN